MLWAVAFLCLLNSANAADRETRHALGQRIIGGQIVNGNARPFMLSLQTTAGHHCGAAVLSRTWAVTALHCLVVKPLSDYYVRAGSTSTSSGGTVHNLTRIQVYNDSTYEFLFSELFHHDIALFEVSPPFAFSKTLRPAQLPKQNAEVPATLTVSGWGYNGMYNIRPSDGRLRTVRVPYVPYKDCVNLLPWYRQIVKKDYHLCFGSFGKDACYGDSGGPLTNRITIYGVVSLGFDCGKKPGVYAKVSFYRDWIQEIIRS